MSDELPAHTWNPPIPGDDSVYPYNHVTQTRGGHIFEVDDTLGSERIREQHKSGTSRTIKPDGSKEEVIHGDSYTIVHGNGNILISGFANITINGSCGMTVNGNYDMQVNGDMNCTVAGSYNLKVGSNQLNEVSGDYAQNIVGGKKAVVGNGLDTTVTAGGSRTNVYGGNNETIVQGSNILTATEASNITSKTIDHISSTTAKFSGTDVTVRAAGTLETFSYGKTNIQASRVTVDATLTDFLGDVKVDGTVDTTENITSRADVRSNNGVISLTQHTHIGDGTGSAPGPTSPPILG
jgi:hypothetical protein